MIVFACLTNDAFLPIPYLHFSLSDFLLSTYCLISQTTLLAFSLPVLLPIGFPVIYLLPDLPDNVTSLFPACTVAFLDPLCMTFCLPLDPATVVLYK